MDWTFFAGSYVGQNVVLPMRGYSTDGVCGLQFAQWAPFNYLLLNRGQSSHHLRPIIRGHYRRVIITCTPVFIKPYVLLNCTQARYSVGLKLTQTGLIGKVLVDDR